MFMKFAIAVYRIFNIEWISKYLNIEIKIPVFLFCESGFLNVSLKPLYSVYINWTNSSVHTNRSMKISLHLHPMVCLQSLFNKTKFLKLIRKPRIIEWLKWINLSKATAHLKFWYNYKDTHSEKTSWNETSAFTKNIIWTFGKLKSITWNQPLTEHILYYIY